MAGNWGSAPRPDSGYVGVVEAATMLGISTDLVRKRAQQGLIPFETSPGGHRRFRRLDIEAMVGNAQLAPRRSGKPVTRAVGERVKLDADGERECLRIAEAAATTACQAIAALEWDGALSDAFEGIAIALSRPAPDIPWEVSCWNHARWHILKGVRKRSGVNSRAYTKGMRYQSLPEHLKQPVSIEGLTETFGDGWTPRSTVDDFSPQLIEDLRLSGMLDRLNPMARIALVNSVAHRFTDAEIAKDMGVRPKDVASLRAQALDELRAVV